MEIYIVGTLIQNPNLKSTRPIYYKYCYTCTRINYWGTKKKISLQVIKIHNHVYKDTCCCGATHLSQRGKIHKLSI